MIKMDKLVEAISSFIKDKFDVMKGDIVENVPPEYDYEKIECYMQGVRDYIKFIKRGYSRTTHLVSLDLRNKRIKLLGKESNDELEKRVFLQTIDFLWRAHLQYLEHLRQVIGLRGYAAKDPLEEFKREAFKLFEGLLHKIKTDFITFLNNIEVAPKKVEDTTENKKKFKDHPKFTDRKMKRNEPCFCNSGKKYKHCHGAL